jgi:hypothetical protein
MLAAFRRCTDQPIAAGFPADDAVLGAGTAMNLGVQPWLSAVGGSVGDVPRRDQVLESAQPFAPEVCAVYRDQVDDPPRAWTLRRVELLVAGLETRLAG